VAMRKELLGNLLGLATITIWGSTYIVSKMVLETYMPTQVLLMRFLMAAVVLTIIYPKFEKFKDLRHELLLVAAAVCLSGYFLCENTALTKTYATNVSLIVATMPIISLILTGIVDKVNHWNKNVIVGFIIAYTGVVIIVIGGESGSSIKIIGDGIALLAAMCFAFYSLILSKINSEMNTIRLTRNIFYYVVVIIFLANLVKGNLKPEVFPLEKLLDPPMAMGLLFLGVMASSLSFMMWNQSIKYIGGMRTSKYVYFGPVITAIIAAIYLNESITMTIIIGAVLIIGGVYLSERKVSNKKDQNSVKEIV